jgi:hypothetical protein
MLVSEEVCLSSNPAPKLRAIENYTGTIQANVPSPFDKDHEDPGLGLPAALPPPPRLMSPAKKDASASFWVFPSGDVMPPGDVGSGVW